MQLTKRFEDALVYAAHAHAGQVQKERNVPYLAHLLAVASIALEHKATEDEAIGALLHDAAEDAGGRGRLEDIRQRFGPAVAEIVEGCTDTFKTPKPEWLKRKQAYIERLPKALPSVRLVSACDKLHNARSILADYRDVGDKVFDRFKGKKQGTLWYYRALVSAFRQAGPDALIDELDRTLTELERVANGGRQIVKAPLDGVSSKG